MAEIEHSNEVLEEFIEGDENTSSESEDEDPNVEKQGTKRKAEKQGVKEEDDNKAKKKQKGKKVTATTLTSQSNPPPRCSLISQPFFPHPIASTAGIASVGLIPFLSRIEKKIDWLTFLMTGTASHDYPQQQVITLQNDLEETCSRSMNMHSMDNKKDMHVQNESRSYTNLAARQQKEEYQTASTNLSVNATDNIVLLHNRSKSSTNFAVLLVREMFEHSELIGHNVCGVRGKLQLDPVRINRIKDLVDQFYPSPLAERELVWRKCRKAVDSFLRKLKV